MRRPFPRPRRTAQALGGSLLLAGTLALAACGAGGGANTSGTSTSTSTSTTQAQTILQHVQQDNLTTTNVNTTERLDTSNGPITTTSTGDIILHPFAAQLSTSTQTGSQSTATSEIVANNTVYVKQANSNNYQAVPVPANALNVLPIVSLQNVSQLQNLQYVGQGTVNGTTTDEVSGVGTQTVGSAQVSYTENLWVNANNYQPVKMTITSTTPAGSLLATTMFKSWNQPTAITPPNGSPVTAG